MSSKAVIAAARATYDTVHMRPSSARVAHEALLSRARLRRRREWIRRLTVALFWSAVIALSATAAAQAQEPSPTPTLAPVISDTTSATQTLQVQELLRELVYGEKDPTTISGTVTTTLAADSITMTAESDATWLSTVITKTTSSGSPWIIERRFTYGEAAVGVILMGLCVLMVVSVLTRVVIDR